MSAASRLSPIFDRFLVLILFVAGILLAINITLWLALPVVHIRWLSWLLLALVVGASLGASWMFDMAVRLRRMLSATFSTSFQIALAVAYAFEAARLVVFLAWISVFCENVPCEVAARMWSFLLIWVPWAAGLIVFAALAGLARLRSRRSAESSQALSLHRLPVGWVHLASAKRASAPGEDPGGVVAVATVGSLAVEESGDSWPAHPGGVRRWLPLGLLWLAIVAIMAGSLCMQP